jgi:predicted pyridoxine 5'-phosphate oxidase superfamily flavin-nucleotide-binding protein
MERGPFYHEGMRELQDRFDGRRVADALERHRRHEAFWDSDRELIESASFFFIATAWGDYVDCSIKSGDPGFVRIVGDNVIEFPEYDGNSMYRTLGNIARNPNVGLLFLRFDGTSLRVRINGKATIVENPEVVARHHGAKLVVRVECEIYPNCPRYMPRLGQALPSPYVPRPGQGTPPAPEWKRRDYLRNLLPEGDPHREKLERGKD